MSAKDANPAGEVGKANNKDGDLIESPNITHASADESEPYIDAKEEARKAARKKAETVEIDGRRSRLMAFQFQNLNKSLSQKKSKPITMVSYS